MILKRNMLALTLVLLALLQLSTQKTFPRLPLEVIQVMGSRAMRYHHFLWHNIRDLYPLLDEATQKAITDIGWEPPRTSTIYYPNGTSHANEENFSGEDFLYMHTQMIDQANEILANTPGVSMKKIVGFESTPAPDDPDYPVPCNYSIPGNDNFTNLIVSMKTDDFYYNVIVPAEQALKDPEVLRRMNLGQLGSRIEYTVHQYMHIRFSKKTPFGIRQTTFNPAPNIDSKWDDLSYQWLIDFYASQVNPIFWRIHGWVNNVLEDWKKANGVEEVQWQHTWVGGPAANLSALLEVSANSENAKRDPGPPVNLDTGNTFSPVTSGDDDNATDNNSRLLQDGESHEGHGHGHMGMHSVEAMEKLVEILMKATAGKESGLHTVVEVTPVSQW